MGNYCACKETPKKPENEFMKRLHSKAARLDIEQNFLPIDIQIKRAQINSSAVTKDCSPNVSYVNS